MELTAVFRKVREGYIGLVEEVPGANSHGDWKPIACSPRNRFCRDLEIPDPLKYVKALSRCQSLDRHLYMLLAGSRYDDGCDQVVHHVQHGIRYVNQVIDSGNDRRNRHW